MLLNEQFNYILKNYINDRSIFQNTETRPRKEISDIWPVRRFIRMKDPEKYPQYKTINIPCTIDSFFPNISTEKGKKRYLTKGSSGEGNMSVSPWIGIFDKDITTSARKEYAVVYLFDNQMKRFYLSLNQGWTQYEDSIVNKKGKKGDYASPILRFEKTKEAASAISQNAKIARSLINSAKGFSLEKIDLSSEIDPLKDKKLLRNKNNLAWGYELGNILSKCYEVDKIPSEDELIEDLFNMIVIYRELKILLDGKSIVQIKEKGKSKLININDLIEDQTPESNSKKNEKQHHISANAAITGNKAEEIFEFDISQSMGYDVKNMTHMVGLGYDFISTDKKTFFEIKGFKNDSGFGDFRITETEWKVAKQKGDNYILVLINNVFGPNHNVLTKRNPYIQYKDKIGKKKTNPVFYYSLKKKDI